MLFLVVSGTCQVTGGGQVGVARALPRRAATVSAKAFILTPNVTEVDVCLSADTPTFTPCCLESVNSQTDALVLFLTHIFLAFKACNAKLLCATV